MNPEYIIIHHSLTADGQTVSWGAIRKYHTETLRWRDIGYHFGIELIGDHYEILLGRFLDQEGAHCREMRMNRFSIGICNVGNFDLIEPPRPQWERCIELTRRLMKDMGINAERVLGHNELAGYKSCPGKLWDINLFRAQL